MAVPASSTNIYFTSGTAAPVVSVESTMLLPLLFVIVALLFLTIAQRMGRALTERPPLQAYTINLLGSITGVATFALLSWLELPPVVWFGVAFAAALPFLVVAVACVCLLTRPLAMTFQLPIISYGLIGFALWF